MARQEIRTDKAPNPAGAYSQGIVAGGFLYTAGFGPQDPATGTLVEGGVAEQTAQVMRNIAAVLDEKGLGFADVVKSTVHLADLGDFAEFNRVYESFLERPYPVRTTVGSTLSGILVEIDVVAALRS
ncbi:MAG TPA: Rid family detoxifying hydrolase [Actinopolymorphaceae bacterium]|nr:Rid family detoxifying hydrolase [Actinopolymorphaceae bacterium]